MVFFDTWLPKVLSIYVLKHTSDFEVVGNALNTLGLLAGMHGHLVVDVTSKAPRCAHPHIQYVLDNTIMLAIVYVEI